MTKQTELHVYQFGNQELFGIHFDRQMPRHAIPCNVRLIKQQWQLNWILCSRAKVFLSLYILLASFEFHYIFSSAADELRMQTVLITNKTMNHRTASTCIPFCNYYAVCVYVISSFFIHLQCTQSRSSYCFDRHNLIKLISNIQNNIKFIGKF